MSCACRPACGDLGKSRWSVSMFLVLVGGLAASLRPCSAARTTVVASVGGSETAIGAHEANLEKVREQHASVQRVHTPGANIAGLFPNEYFVVWSNKLRTANQELKKRYFGPLFCANDGHYWFNLTEVLQTRPPFICVKVLCPTDGGIPQGTLMEDCGDAINQYLVSMHLATPDITSGLRLSYRTALFQADHLGHIWNPFARQRHQQDGAHTTRMLTRAVTPMDSLRNPSPTGYELVSRSRYIFAEWSKPDAWEVAVDKDRCQTLVKDMPRLSSPESVDSCIEERNQQRISCEASWDSCTKDPIAWYKAQRSQPGGRAFRECHAKIFKKVINWHFGDCKRRVIRHCRTSKGYCDQRQDCSDRWECLSNELLPPAQTLKRS